MLNYLILDFSEEQVAMHFNGSSEQLSTRVNDIFNSPEIALESLRAELKAKEIIFTDLIVSIPLACINYQVVTLPDNVSDKDKLVFLGLEINRKLIGKHFGVMRLDVTKRDEGEQPLCDYLILSPKAEVLSRIIEIEKALETKLFSVIPSFMVLGAEPVNELRATAWLGEDRSEIVIWGKDSPLAMSYIPNNGDQTADVNRFIVQYFDHVDNLNLSMVYLFGPRMRDSALGFGLTYPHVIFNDPTRYLLNNLYKAPEQLNIAKEIKLPRAPIPMTPRNITLIASGGIFALLLVLTILLSLMNLAANSEKNKLEAEAIKNKKYVNEIKSLQKEKAAMSAEKDFYLDITRRRTPWAAILADISKLTPKDLWFERLNATKMKVMVFGKAQTADDVSNFAINLNSHSEYVEDVQIMGTRDYEENNRVYSEFQLSSRLKSPTGKFEETEPEKKRR